MSNLHQIDSMLKNQHFTHSDKTDIAAYRYAEAIASVENCIAVVSDLKAGKSKIYAGDFGQILGLKDYYDENSIWERQILSLMDEEEREEKYLAEMRFFNYLRRLPAEKRHLYYLTTHLHFILPDGRTIDVQHKMYYWYEVPGEAVRYGICLYSPSFSEFKYKSIVVNSVTGESEPLTHSSDNKILSRREIQVLGLIARGLTSQKIADELYLSRHTISRHRQDIISKLQVKNSIEACRVARQLNIL